MYIFRGKNGVYVCKFFFHITAAWTGHRQPVGPKASSNRQAD